MTRVDINLGKIKETPLLVPGTHVMKITSAGMDEKRTPRIWARVVVEGYQPFFHNWYLTCRAIQTREPSISLMQFCKLFGLGYDPKYFNSYDPEYFDTKGMVGITFKGLVDQEPYNGEIRVRLVKIFSPVR